MIDVFLSASVPLPDRDKKYFESSDVFLIRESIRALVEVVLPRGRITFGGHPAITPLLALYSKMINAGNDRVTIFQSMFFSEQFPDENKDFADIKYIPAVVGSRNASILAMRTQMLESRKFSAAILIGGMEGVHDEAAMFRQFHPNAPIFPIASTGAAAAIEFGEGLYPKELATDISFASLFRRSLLPKPLG